jgi:hypothetical protein
MNHGLREQAMASLPPTEVIHLFNRVERLPERRLQEISRSYTVAQTTTQIYRERLTEMSSGLNEVGACIEILKQKMSSLYRFLDDQERSLYSGQQQVMETPHSHRLHRLVGNQMDVDHADVTPSV